MTEYYYRGGRVMRVVKVVKQEVVREQAHGGSNCMLFGRN